MPVDLMKLAEGSTPTSPGRRPSGGGSNKDLVARFEQQVPSAEKTTVQPPRRKWEPPKPDAKFDVVDSPVRRGSGNPPPKPPPVAIAARASDLVDKEEPVSPRLADNPFMRRDSNSSQTPPKMGKNPSAPPLFPSYADAYPVAPNSVEARPDMAKPKPMTKQPSSVGPAPQTVGFLETLCKCLGGNMGHKKPW